MRNVPFVYVAAPLFNENEREFNDALARKLNSYVSVFLPQRDGELLVDLIRSGMEKRLAERLVFEGDLLAMRSANLLIAVLDGAHIDEGVAFEIGFMNGNGQRCVGLQTDVRRALPTGNNPMIAQGLSQVFAHTDELLGWIAEWSSCWLTENFKSVA